MTAQDVDESAQFQEPISPTASHGTSAPTATSSNPAKPSITGIIKNVVKAPSQDEIVEPLNAEGAINSVGADGGARKA